MAEIESLLSKVPAQPKGKRKKAPTTVKLKFTDQTGKEEIFFMTIGSTFTIEQPMESKISSGNYTATATVFIKQTVEFLEFI